MVFLNSLFNAAYWAASFSWQRKCYSLTHQNEFSCFANRNVVFILFILICKDKDKTLEALIEKLYEFLNINEKNLRVFLYSWWPTLHGYFSFSGKGIVFECRRLFEMLILKMWSNQVLILVTMWESLQLDHSYYYPQPGSEEKIKVINRIL